MKNTCRVIEDERVSRAALCKIVINSFMLNAARLYIIFALYIFVVAFFRVFFSRFFFCFQLLCSALVELILFHPMISFRTLVLRFGMVSAVPAARACTFHFFFFIYSLTSPRIAKRIQLKSDTKKGISSVYYAIS